MTAPLILLGGGGHAAVLAEILHIQKHTVLGFTDAQIPPFETSPAAAQNLHLLGDDGFVLATYAPDTVALVNGLGSTGKIGRRETLFTQFTAAQYSFAHVIHPTSYVSPSVSYGQGLQVLAGSVVNTDAKIGDNVLINSHAVVEHHCVVGAHSHIASGAVICGHCSIGQSVHVGAGAVLNQGVTIGDGAIIASGAVVISDVPAGSLMAGIPALHKR